MIAIPLTSPKYGEKLFFIDAEDFDKIKHLHWHLDYVKHMDTFYVRNSIRIEGKTKNKKLHRFLMNCPEGMIVDHKDGNTLNNTRENLRICSPIENSRNRGKRIGTLKYKGVSYVKSRGFYYAHIRHNDQLIHLGQFEHEVNAAKAYNVAAIKFFGEFARLNIITDEDKIESPRRENYSKLKGVSFDKTRGKYVAYLCYAKKTFSLGRYKTELEAAIAYNNACDKYGVPERKNILPEEL